MSYHNEASSGGEKYFETLVQKGEWEHSVENPVFSPGEVGAPNNQGQVMPKSALASDQAEFTGPIEPTFTKNAGKFSEDKGLAYNKGDDVSV